MQVLTRHSLLQWWWWSYLQDLFSFLEGMEEKEVIKSWRTPLTGMSVPSISHNCSSGSDGSNRSLRCTSFSPVSLWMHPVISAVISAVSDSQAFTSGVLPRPQFAAENTALGCVTLNPHSLRMLQPMHYHHSFSTHTTSPVLADSLQIAVFCLFSWPNETSCQQMLNQIPL